MKFIQIEVIKNKKGLVRKDQIAAIEATEWYPTPHDPKRGGYFQTRIYLVGGSIIESFTDYDRILKEWCDADTP